MQNGITWVLGIIAAAVILGGAYFVWSGMQANDALAPNTNSESSSATDTETPATASATSQTDTENAAAQTSAPTTASVTYDGRAYSPQTVTIKRGGTVTWTNTGSGNMWVASDVHPTHTEYAGTSRREHCPDTTGSAFDQCEGGSSYSFTFTKSGTWEYHDHINASAIGSVIVVE